MTSPDITRKWQGTAFCSMHWSQHLNGKNVPHNGTLEDLRHTPCRRQSWGIGALKVGIIQQGGCAMWEQGNTHIPSCTWTLSRQGTACGTVKPPRAFHGGFCQLWYPPRHILPSFCKWEVFRYVLYWFKWRWGKSFGRTIKDSFC